MSASAFEMMRNAPSRAPHLPQAARGFIDCTPVCFEGAPDGPFAGEAKWRGVKNFEHATICRAFSLDPARFSFELPSSVRGIGANQQGHGGGASARYQSGFVFLGAPGKSNPVAKLTIARDGDKFADVDPTSRRDWENLSRR